MLPNKLYIINQYRLSQDTKQILEILECFEQQIYQYFTIKKNFLWHLR